MFLTAKAKVKVHCVDVLRSNGSSVVDGLSPSSVRDASISPFIVLRSEFVFSPFFKADVGLETTIYTYPRSGSSRS